MNKEKLAYIDYFRAFAIIMIVAGHTMCWGSSDMYKLNCYLLGGGTSLFVFIAGYLFQYLSYKFDYKTYLKKKLLNVIMPYWIVIAPAAIALAFTCSDINNYLYDKAFLVRLLNPFLWGQIVSLPLWFIPMIAVIFLLAPILIKLFKHKIIWYSLLVSALIYTGMRSRATLGFDMTLKGNLDVSIVKWNLKWLLLYLRTVFYFIPAYMLGMSICDFVEKHTIWIKDNAKNLTLISGLSYVLCYFILILYMKSDVGSSNITRVLLIFPVLFFFMHNEGWIKSKIWLHKALKFLAEYSFGIFFIHFYIINLLTAHTIYSNYSGVNYLNIAQNSPKCCILSIVSFLITFFGAIGILLILKKVLIKLGVKNTRMIIGV